MSKSSSITFPQEHLMQIIFQEQANVIQSVKKSKRKKVNLIITDQALLFEDGSETNCFYWVKINSIDINGKEIIISLSIDDKENDITFQISPIKTDIKQIFAIIIDLLQRILVPKKYQKVNKSKYYTDPPPITGQSIMSRFLGYYHPSDLIEKENSNIFRLSIMTKNPILKMTNFKSYQNIISAILHAMSFINFIDYLELGETDSILSDIINNFENVRKISCISFGSKDKSKFPDFLNKINKSSDNMSIEGISISSLSLSSEECQNFIDTINNKKISYLGFHEDSLSSKGFTCFMNNANSMKNLICLNFNGYSNLDLDSLSSKVSFITILSLANCGLNLQKAIKSIFQNDFKKLSELDLSSNQCNSTFTIKQNFPPQLSKFVVGNTNWQNSKNLISFLSFVFKKMNSILKLNIYSSTFDDSNEWKIFFSKLAQLDIDLSSVRSFGWDNNPIDSSLFVFLEKCTNLETLSISSFSIIKGIEKQLDSLIKYAKNSKSKKIKTLILSSDDSIKSKFKKRISEILLSLAKWKTLTTLDISQNMIGDDGIECLQKLLSKNPIKLVIFDRSCPSSIKNLIDFFNTVPKGCKVNFPSEDVIAFLNTKNTKFDDIQTLIQLSSKMLNDEKSNIIDLKTNLIANSPPKKKTLLKRPNKSPLDDQFFVFSDHNYKSDLFIPEYVKSDDYKPLKVKPNANQKNNKKYEDNDETKKKKTNKKGNTDEDDDIKTKKKNKKNKNKEDEDDEDYESDSDQKSPKKKKRNKRGKNKDGESSESDYGSEESSNDFKKSKNKHKKGIKNHNKSKTHSSSYSTSSDEEDYSDSDSTCKPNPKKKRKTTGNAADPFEMRTLMPFSSHPNRKPSPKSLTGNNNKGNKSRSVYDMHTKVAHHSYLGKTKPDKETSKRRTRKNKFDEIDNEISSSSDSSSGSNNNDYELRSRIRKKIPPKIVEIDESSSENFSDESFDNQLMKTNGKSSKKKVHQKVPPPLERSDDYDEGDDYNKSDDGENSRKFKSKSRSRTSVRKIDDDDDDENNISPKPPNWSFPLMFVPSPDDNKQIVEDLSEKYSVGNLLRYMNQS